MDRTELLNTAQHVVDLEVKIDRWTGTPSQWLSELARLHEIIENLIHAAMNGQDPAEMAFLQCLQLKTDKCLERVLKRADIPIESGYFHYPFSMHS